MAPKDTPKATTKVKTVVARTTKAKLLKSSPVTLKKTMLSTKQAGNKPLNVTTMEARQRTRTAPGGTILGPTGTAATPKSKENKEIPMPGSVTKSAKKPAWKRRPKAAHSGVPLPEKMKIMLQKLKDADCSL